MKFTCNDKIIKINLFLKIMHTLIFGTYNLCYANNHSKRLLYESYTFNSHN